jgi:hypothetical protein
MGACGTARWSSFLEGGADEGSAAQRKRGVPERRGVAWPREEGRGGRMGRAWLVTNTEIWARAQWTVCAISACKEEKLTAPLQPIGVSIDSSFKTPSPSQQQMVATTRLRCEELPNEPLRPRGGVLCTWWSGTVSSSARSRSALLSCRASQLTYTVIPTSICKPYRATRTR